MNQQLGYNDTLDPDDQISAEEEIAAFLFDQIDIDEEVAAELGREILKTVLAKFRPDLFEAKP